MYNAHWIHSLPYSKFIELTLNNMQIKISPFRRTLQKIPYTCNRIEATLPKTYQKETLYLSQSRERRKFKTYSEREHSGSRAIAWAAITIS